MRVNAPESLPKGSYEVLLASPLPSELMLEAVVSVESPKRRAIPYAVAHFAAVLLSFDPCLGFLHL